MVWWCCDGVGGVGGCGSCHRAGLVCGGRDEAQCIGWRRGKSMETSDTLLQAKNQPSLLDDVTAEILPRYLAVNTSLPRYLVLPRHPAVQVEASLPSWVPSFGGFTQF